MDREKALEAFERIVDRFATPDPQDQVEPYEGFIGDVYEVRSALTQPAVDVDEAIQRLTLIQQTLEAVIGDIGFQPLHALPVKKILEETVVRIDAAKTKISCAEKTQQTSDIDALRKRLLGKIQQKKGFYSVSVGHSEVKQAHKAGILKGLDAAEKEIEAAFDLVKKSEG